MGEFTLHTLSEFKYSFIISGLIPLLKETLLFEIKLNIFT
jgi:hypothetical protein